MPIDAALVAQPIVALPSAKATARDAVRTLRCGEPALDACPGLISAAINTPMIGHNRGPGISVKSLPARTRYRLTRRIKAKEAQIVGLRNHAEGFSSLV